MRALVILGRLLPFLIAFLRDRRSLVLVGGPVRRTDAHHARRAARLARTLAELGPTFIKLAQLFAARADILPEPYLGAIGTLTDQVPPLPAGTAERVVQEELGASVQALFERFDAVPLAAASLGQVHRARWQGRDVVIKVLRPGVEELVTQDLAISFRILNVLQVFFPGHQLRAIAAIFEEFARRIREELDFREEAKHGDMLRRHFAGNGRVVVPEVIVPLVRQRVLGLEYVEGTRIDRLHDRLASGELRLEALMETLVEAYLKMALEDGLLHADPHPGNLLVDAAGRLVILDFGMVVRVEPAMKERLLSTVLAAVRRDVDGVMQGFYDLGLLTPDVDRGTVRDAAEQLMAISVRDDVSSHQVQQVVEQVLRTFYDWPLTVPEDLVYFGRAAVLVEGLGHRYDPSFNLLPLARPVMSRFVGKVLEGAAQDPRARLTDLGLEAAQLLRTGRELVRRLEREELRLRWHPRDTAELQRFIGTQVRRGLLAFSAFTVGVISTLVWLGSRRLEILVLGLLFSAGLFTVVFVLPSHLFVNPLRIGRWWVRR